MTMCEGTTFLRDNTFSDSSMEVPFGATAPWIVGSFQKILVPLVGQCIV